MANIKKSIDNKIMASKIDHGINELKNKSTEELAQKLSKINKEELMKKLKEIDTDKIREMNIDINAIRQKLSQQDLEKIKILAGNNQKEIMSKINEILYNK